MNDSDYEFVVKLTNLRDQAMAEQNFALGALLTYVIGAIQEQIVPKYSDLSYKLISALLEKKRTDTINMAMMVEDALKEVEW